MAFHSTVAVSEDLQTLSREDPLEAIRHLSKVYSGKTPSGSKLIHGLPDNEERDGAGALSVGIAPSELGVEHSNEGNLDLSIEPWLKESKIFQAFVRRLQGNKEEANATLRFISEIELYRESQERGMKARLDKILEREAKLNALKDALRD